MEIIIIILCLIVSGLIYYAIDINKKYTQEKTSRIQSEDKLKNLSEEEKLKLLDNISQKKIGDAQKQADEILKKAKEDAIAKKKELVDIEKAITERDKLISKQSDNIIHKEKQLEEEQARLQEQAAKIKKEQESISEKLSQIANLNEKEAKEQLFKQLKTHLDKDYAREIREAKNKLEIDSQDLAKEVIISAMTDAGTDYVSEYTTTMFKLENKEMKGRIIGKEGRNIKAFEKLTGVQIMIDDEDETNIVLSCFDPLRRELSRITLERLVKDGRINPVKIENAVQKARGELSKQILKDGEEIAYKAGFTNLTPEHFKYLGRMKYRFSYGQNLGTHTLEVVNFAEKAASELGLDPVLAKECALWHDIGKVESQEKEGNHMELGEHIGLKLGLNEDVLNAMYAHHMEKEPSCMESALIYIADANSSARPGSRYDNIEDYVKRIKAIEDIAKSHNEVKECYAVEAGREIRVFVDPVIAGDDRILILADDIAQEIHKTQNYPGSVKVTVIREIRATSNAS